MRAEAHENAKQFIDWQESATVQWSVSLSADSIAGGRPATRTTSPHCRGVCDKLRWRKTAQKALPHGTHGSGNRIFVARHLR
jgi:hypothetical protein